MIDITEIHKSIGSAINENYCLKEENKRLKHTLLTVLLHGKNKGKISQMKSIGRVYVDWDNINIITKSNHSVCIQDLNGNVIKEWDDVPRTEYGEDEIANT